jgi:hypothetical protein
MIFTSGLPETRCGLGSTLEFTTELRRILPQLIKTFDIDVLVDAPCGDFYWMAQTDISGIDYIGYDNDPANIKRARRTVSTFWPKSTVFYEADISKDDLLDSDMILCRDYFQHVPYRNALDTIENFKSTKAKWLMATSHKSVGNDDVEVGGFSPINLMLPPINFPKPLYSMPDGENRILGLWDMDTI